MSHLALNLLAWRTTQAKQKIIHDSMLSIFLIGIFALMIEGALYLTHLYIEQCLQHVRHIHHTLQVNTQALHQAEDAKRAQLQIQKMLSIEKNNQMLWQSMAEQLNTLYQMPAENIVLKNLVWQPQHWHIEGFAENNEALMRYQKKLAEKNIALDIITWQPHHAGSDMANFALSG